MLNYLELENWKAHGTSKILFSKGTNVFIGQMGAGKSSVLDAISFALFGTFPSIKSRRSKINMLIRNKPEQKNTSKIKLSFSVDNSDYVVERTISINDTAKARLEKNGTYIQSQPERVTEEIEKALKIDYDLFSRAVYSEQNRLDYFLEMSSSDRKKQIDNLLGIDKFALAQENAGSLVNKVKDIISESDKLIKTLDIEKIKKELSSLTEEINTYETNLKENTKELSALKLSLQAAEKTLLEKKLLLNKKIFLEKEMVEVKSKISMAEQDMRILLDKKLPSEEEIIVLLKELEQRQSSLKKEQVQISDMLQKLQSNFGKIEKEYHDLEKNISEKAEIEKALNGKNPETIRSDIDSNSSLLGSIELEIAHLSLLKSESEKSVSELKKHIAKCPICDNELTEEKKSNLINSKQKVIEEATLKITIQTKNRAQKKDEIKRLNEELNKTLVLLDKNKALSQAGEKLPIVLSEKKQLEEKIKKEKENFTSIANQLSEVSEELSKQRSAKEKIERLSKILSEKTKLSILLKSKEEEYLKMEINNDQIDDLQKSYTSIHSSISEMSTKLLSTTQMLQDRKKQFESKNKEFITIERIAKDLELKRSSIDNISRFRNALQETQAILRHKLIGSINEVMQSIWPEIYPYGDYTGIEFQATETDYDLKLRVFRNGAYEWETVNAVASGGERSIACMAMRIAFSLVLVPNLKWLILDEPTHNIDRQGISKIVSLLNERLPSIIEQILIITHDEQLKQVSNGRIYSFTRDKAENKETVISEL